MLMHGKWDAHAIVGTLGTNEGQANIIDKIEEVVFDNTWPGVLLRILRLLPDPDAQKKLKSERLGLMGLLHLWFSLPLSEFEPPIPKPAGEPPVEPPRMIWVTREQVEETDAPIDPEQARNEAHER
jgi:hypothetical protein